MGKKQGLKKSLYQLQREDEMQKNFSSGVNKDEVVTDSEQLEKNNSKNFGELQII